MPKPDEETEKLRKELTTLADQCRSEQKKVCDAGDLGSGASIPKAKAVVRKVLKGHINKVQQAEKTFALTAKRIVAS